MSVCVCHRGIWACRSPSRGFDIDHFLLIQRRVFLRRNSGERHHMEANHSRIQRYLFSLNHRCCTTSSVSFFFALHHNSLVHLLMKLPLYGVVVSILMLLVSSIHVPVAGASQARSLILPAVEDSSVMTRSISRS